MEQGRHIRPLPPARVTLERMTKERVEMYRHVPPLGKPISVGITPFPGEYSVPENKDIAWAIHRLRLNRSGGTLVIQAEHLCKWIQKMT